MKKFIKETKRFFFENKKGMFQLGILFALVFIPLLIHGNCEAATSQMDSSMPWNSGLKKLANEATGPIPKIAGFFAIVGIGISQMFGEMQAFGKTAIRVLIGVSISIGAAPFVSLLALGDTSITVAGCLF